MSPASPPDVGSTFSTSTTPAAWDLQPVQPVSTFSVTSTLIPPFNDMSIGSLLVPQSSWDAPSIGSTPLSPPMSEGSATFELTTDIWPLNIPPPATLHHLVETFFSSVPLASRLIHKPTFMASLRLVPTSASFPPVSLLHAICGIASLYSPIIQEWAREAAEDSDTTRPFNSGIVFRPDAEEGVQGDRYYPRKVEDVLGPKPNSFGAAHIQWAGETMKLATRHGDRLLQLLQAAVIVTWYHYSSGLVLGVYAWLASVSKFVVPLGGGLNVSEGFEPLSRLPPQMLFLFGKPKTAIEAETVRNVFWITYVMERLYTAGTVWSMSMSDEDVSQMMPCRSSDFMSGVSVPTRGRQRLFTNNMLLHHHSLTTDAWTLYIKATILVSKVRTFNGRYHLTPNARSSNAETTPTQTEVFLLLDQTIAAFPQHIPPAFRTPVDTTVDPLLYMAHLLPHVAMIQLHDPHANFSDPNDRSAIRMASAVQSILELIYAICATSFDLIYLDHACSFCWFVAGAAIIRLLKVKMNLKDEAGVERLTQDLNVVKFVLGNLGDRTTIGLRQIQLLNELYEAEINSNFDRADYIYTPRRSADAEVQAAIVGDSL
ncbi:hypothetical protein FRC05_001179 [Tulasnella sp. 425]|nr:hypothetical protein FRC05_001179 [Tulasnella sp. 425]